MPPVPFLFSEALHQNPRVPPRQFHRDSNGFPCRCSGSAATRRKGKGAAGSTTAGTESSRRSSRTAMAERGERSRRAGQGPHRLIVLGCAAAGLSLSITLAPAESSRSMVRSFLPSFLLTRSSSLHFLLPFFLNRLTPVIGFRAPARRRSRRRRTCEPGRSCCSWPRRRRCSWPPSRCSCRRG